MSIREIESARRTASAELLSEFFQLSDELGLSVAEQKIIIGDESIHRLLVSINKSNYPLLNDVAIARLVTLKAIKKDIQTLYPDKNWISYFKSPLIDFDGQSPLEVISNDSEEGMIRVQVYLKRIILGAL